MAGAKDIHGSVFQNSTATFMARVEDSQGNQLDQAAVASLNYTVGDADRIDAGESVAILGHERVNLDKAAVIYDTLQTDATWTVDATGYNFRHEIDVTTHEAFSVVGKDYQIRYEVTPVTGQKIVFRFRVRCI